MFIFLCKPNNWFTRTSSQAQSCHDTSNQNNQSELGLMRHSSWQHNKKKGTNINKFY